MLPKDERLTTQSEIKAAIREKEFEIKTPLLYLAGRKNQQKQSRLVVVASKKLGEAVARNRIRRLVREAFKLVKEKFKAPVDLAIFPTRKVLSESVLNIAGDISRALVNSSWLK